MTPISITDIAKAAGVSPSTVSRALQDHPRIGSQRRSVIRALAQEMGYQPSQAARSLVTGRTKTLGIVVSDVTDPFVTEVLKGAEQAGRELGYSLLFATSSRDSVQEFHAARLLLARQVDGMIVISSRGADRYAELLRSNGTPLILVNNELDGEGAYSVRTDNAGGMRQVLTHLLELGHRRIAFIAGPEAGRSSKERLQSYREISALCELPEASELVIDGNGLLEDGRRAFAVLVGQAQPPTAVTCYNDLTAIGLMAAAHEAGTRVPDDLSVIGYDNIPLSAFTVPPLTSVEQPKEVLGRMAVMNCVRALTGEHVPDVVVPNRLVIRRSTSYPYPKEIEPS
jgi:DNA-binding LacI/PurR family transcriptional regulator